MNRATIRALVRRRLNEVVVDNWDDATLNVFIDLAYQLVTKQVRKVDPEAMLAWDYRATVVGEHWYEKPAGTRGPVEIAIKKSSADSDWSPLKRKPYFVARDWTGDEMVYCHRGTYIGLFPAPTVAVVDGIQFIHAPTDALAVDTDVPKLEPTLHLAIAIWASLIAKGESPEDDSKDAKELGRLVGDIPSDYGSPDLGQPVGLSLDVGDARGRLGGMFSSPGVDRR